MMPVYPKLFSMTFIADHCVSAYMLCLLESFYICFPNKTSEMTELTFEKRSR